MAWLVGVEVSTGGVVVVAGLGSGLAAGVVADVAGMASVSAATTWRISCKADGAVRLVVERAEVRVVVMADEARNGTTPGGRRYRCMEIGSYARAQELLRQGHIYLDSNGDGEACESLKH